MNYRPLLKSELLQC